jgi:hypothetical protein
MKMIVILALCLFAVHAAADTVAVQCCEGTGVSLDTTEPMPPEPCGKSSSTWTMKAGATAYTTCAVGQSCAQLTCAQKGCTASSGWSCPRFRYHTCGTVPKAIEDQYCRGSTTTNAGVAVTGSSLPIAACAVLGSLVCVVTSGLYRS